MENIICTKCSSSRVEHFTKEMIKEPDPITIDDYIKGSDINTKTTIMTYTEMVLLCKDCGYRKEYTSPRINL